MSAWDELIKDSSLVCVERKSSLIYLSVMKVLTFGTALRLLVSSLS